MKEKKSFGGSWLYIVYTHSIEIELDTKSLYFDFDDPVLHTPRTPHCTGFYIGIARIMIDK